MIKNLGAERGLLASIIKNPESVYEIMNIVSSSDFYNDGNRQIFEVVKNIIVENKNGSVDKMNIISTAVTLGFEDFSEVTNKHELVDAIITTSKSAGPDNAEKFALQVKEASVRRGLSDKANEVRDLIENNADKKLSELISMAESMLFNYAHSVDGHGDIVQLPEGFEDWANAMADAPQEFRGLKTQFHKWDVAIGGGLRKGTVNVIGARAKTGKSAFALNVAVEVAMKQKIPILYLDTELSMEYQRTRLGSMVSEVDSNILETGKWRNSKEAIDKVRAAWDFMKDKPLYHVNCAGWGIDQIVSAIRKFIVKYVRYDDAGRVKPCLVIMDYLKLMDPNSLGKGLQEHQLLGIYMSRLHDIANIYQIPMLVMVQLNRDGMEKEDESVVAGADKIIWFCSSFSILKNKTQEEIAADGPHEGNLKLKCVVTRYGHPHAGDNYVNIKRDNKNWKFIEGKENLEIADNIKKALEKQQVNKKELQGEIKQLNDA